MGTISNANCLTTEQGKAAINGMSNDDLVMQDIVQQGAIHAVSFLLANGCNEQTATDMLASLREYASEVRMVAERRGVKLAFALDQTGFN